MHLFTQQASWLVKWILLLALPAFLFACQTYQSSPSSPPSDELRAESALTSRAPIKHYAIGQYRSSSWGFYTNSYWIEGPEGVILIDTQFLPSSTVDAVKTAESYTGKKVVLAIVLHANPDKFNGTQTLKARGIPVVTSVEVQQLIPAVDKLRREWFYERYQPDYPSTLVLPDAIDPSAQQIQAAGLTLRLHRFGPAVSKAHLVVEIDRHLFVGDLAANHYHAWMELGLSSEWIALLRQLQALHPNTIHPGRGNATGAYLLDDQIRYLQFVQGAVKPYFNQKPLTKTDKQKIIERITNQYPGYGMEYFLNLGIPAEYERLFKQ